ncbi:MAG: hypothetical protein J6W95_00080 [Bacteroidales bacterium]|nr:hypothetical protein [Bacteroidales bacterium]
MKRLLLTFLVLSSYLLPLQAQEARSSQHRVFDDHDRLAVLITYTYDSAGVVETRQLQSFDREGRLTRTELYTADEHLLFTEDITYDRHGNRSRCLQTSYDEEGIPTRADYRYKYTLLPSGKWELTLVRLNGDTIYTHE